MKNRSFIRGMSQIVDIWGDPDYYSEFISIEGDAKQIKKDWDFVGLDLTEAIKKYSNSAREKNV